MATHLAANYPEFIDFLFVDRSFGNLEKMGENSFRGPYTSPILNIFSQHWMINSDENFAKSKCYKMLTQDPWDGTVDQYQALNA